PVIRERVPHLRAVRHRRERVRQLPHALPRERRLRAPGEAAGRRSHLAVRGAGDRLQPSGGSMLPLPVPGAAAAGRRTVVRRGRRAGRPPGDRRLRAGARSHQADPRPGQAADRAHDALRYARGRRAQPAAAPRSAVQGVRREPDDQGADRLRGLLRARRARPVGAPRPRRVATRPRYARFTKVAVWVPAAAYFRSNLDTGRAGRHGATSSRPAEPSRSRIRRCSHGRSLATCTLPPGTSTRAIASAVPGRSNRRRWRWRVFGHGSGKYTWTAATDPGGTTS